MKPLIIVLGVAFVGGVALYGKNQRNFWVFQAVMLPVFLYFFGADVMLGKGEVTSDVRDARVFEVRKLEAAE